MKQILQVRDQQARDILGLLKQVATASGSLPLDEVHKATLQAIAKHLFHVEADIDSLDVALDDAPKIISDPDLKTDVMNMAGILPFLEHDGMTQRVDAFERLGQSLGYDKKYAKELHALCRGSVTEIALCQLRALSLESGMPIWKAPIIMAESMFHMDGDRKMLDRYEGYSGLDPGVMGRVMIDYYRDNQFPLPGTPHAVFSNMLLIHDMHHVIAGYPTTPLGEICVIAFGDGMAGADLGKALIGYVGQFQVGIQFDKGLEIWKNQFDPEFAIRAFERGGDATVDFDTFDFDFTDLLMQPLDEVRHKFNISPDGAIINAPGDLWCGDMGIVGQRYSKDHIQRKSSWFQKILAASGKNVQAES
ncbi:MAG: hypothetical protein CMJ32_04775 [Phycisphaerae bacterium]|nr:hypothetical protein [Phycisphaerae bacterium]